jgi:metallophosphoesterase (TIGR00282 family)
MAVGAILVERDMGVQQRTANILMIGDVVGTPGLRALFARLPALARQLDADIVVANGENALSGFGIGRDELDILRKAGVAVVSSGNHVWERKDAAELLDSEPELLRPANYPTGSPGKGSLHLQGRNYEWLILNLQGREGLYAIDCPFRTADEILARASHDYPGALIAVDFHAESVDEKEALAWHLDGRVAVVAGTHTHVQTADERILPCGTGYLTDLGMTGPVDSVIGVKTEICLRRSLTQMPIKMETAEGEALISGALFRIDPETRRCLSVERLSI